MYLLLLLVLAGVILVDFWAIFLHQDLGIFEILSLFILLKRIFEKSLNFTLFNGSNQNLQCGTLSDSDSFFFLYLDGFFMSISSKSPLTLVLGSQSRLWRESLHVQKKYSILSESSTSFGAALCWEKKNLISWMIGMWSKEVFMTWEKTTIPGNISSWNKLDW